ncbi:MAG TPA: nitrate- and nitrite sensing domain-containing protein, partial [Catenuloplanes sp.]
MKSRSSHVRVKIVALLLSLVALWSFAAFVTLREGLNLLSVVQLDEAVGRPSEALVGALQEERRASVVFLARRTAGQRQDLDSQRARTDAARRTFEQRAGSDDTAGSASALLNQRIDEVLTGLTELDRSRRAIDAGSLDRTQAAGVFTGIITGTFRVFSGLAALDAPAVLRDGNALTAFSRAREVLAQEDALLAGVIAAGRFTGTEHHEFVKLVGAQRVLHADVAAELPSADQARYERFVNGSTFARFRAAEDLVVQKGRAGAAAPLDAQAWQAAAEPVFAELRNLVLQAADDLIGRVRPEGIAVVVRIVLAAGLGLIAVIASIIVSITTARSLVRQLERLRTAAWELANERLPRVVDRLREGKTVDVDVEAPPLAFGTDEVGQLGEAFNAVQRTAIKTAVEQAELRRDVREVFLSLARRTQTLVHRQLTMLDAMERREIEPDELEALFRVDHLATRMRRNAENLIVLSGATPGRGWRKPVPLIDIVRGALAEVEDYARVTV